jgi:hypothetical protein
MRWLMLWMGGVLCAAGASNSYVDEAARWRAHYEASLKAPDGWLSVAGLFWLHEGANAVGSDPQSDVVLPARSPKRAGTLRIQSHKVMWEPAKGAKSELKPDSSQHPDVVRLDDAVTFTIIERGKQDRGAFARLGCRDAAQFHRLHVVPGRSELAHQSEMGCLRKAEDDRDYEHSRYDGR